VLDHQRWIQIQESIERLIDDLSHHDRRVRNWRPMDRAAPDEPPPVISNQLDANRSHSALLDEAAAMLAQLLRKAKEAQLRRIAIS
jgi:hypothetical protein